MPLPKYTTSPACLAGLIAVCMLGLSPIVSREWETSSNTDPSEASVDPTFTPSYDPALFIVTEEDLDEPYVVNDLVDDDDWMIDNEPYTYVLISSDREALNEYQSYSELDQIIDP